MKENHFVIVIPVYNAENYIEKSIESVLFQYYKDYDLIVIDDCSTDGTYDIICNLHKKYGTFIKIRNDVRVGSPLHNLITGINILSKNDEDIIITVDGDDWLYNNSVLFYLNEAYQNDNVFMTYGSFIPASGNYGKYGWPISDFRSYRQSNLWLASHLRTFKRKIWNLINDMDLRDVDGEYFKYAGDTAVLYPLLEMCGRNHTKYIDDILYVYNDLNPINEMKIYRDEQLRILSTLKAKISYPEL